MNSKRENIWWIILFLWMGIIFYMSHQPGNISSQQSDLVLKILESIGINLTSSLGEFSTLLIRKVAHVSEYFILCYLFIKVTEQYFDSKKAIIFAIIFTVTYAISDEIHQYFIPGRAMAITDIIIDSIGAILMGITRIAYNKYKIKKLKFLKA